MCSHRSRLCRDQYELLFHHLIFCVCVFYFFSERGKSDGSQDCPPNFSPLRQIVREHAVHPSCWICVLSRPFPSIQTMSEVNPSTAVERKRCSNCVCQVRPLQVLALDLIHVEEYICLIPVFWSQAGIISPGRHGFFSWLHHCFFLRGHHRGPVSQEMLIIIWL